jgi:hypothetical protein
LFVRFLPLFFFAAILGLATIFYKPVVQGVSALFELAQTSKSSDRATADDLRSNGRSDRLSAPAATSVARPTPAPVPAPIAQQTPASLPQPMQSSPAPVAPPANAQPQVASVPQPLKHEPAST